MSNDPKTDRFSDDELRGLLTDVLVSIRGGEVTEEIQQKVEAAIARRPAIDAEVRKEMLVDVVLRVRRPALFEGDWRLKPAGASTTAWMASLEAEASAVVEALLASDAFSDILNEARQKVAQEMLDAVVASAREGGSYRAAEKIVISAQAAALKYGARHEQGV